MPDDVAHLRIIDDQMTFRPKALAVSKMHSSGRLTLNRFHTISSGAGANAPFIYVNFSLAFSSKEREDEAYKWISSFET